MRTRPCNSLQALCWFNYNYYPIKSLCSNTATWHIWVTQRLSILTSVQVRLSFSIKLGVRRNLRSAFHEDTAGSHYLPSNTSFWYFIQQILQSFRYFKIWGFIFQIRDCTCYGCDTSSPFKVCSEIYKIKTVINYDQIWHLNGFRLN